MTALILLSAAVSYLCGMLALSAMFSPRRQGEQGRGEALLFGGLAHVHLLVLLTQWPLWLRLILAGLLWLLVWCLYFSGRVWQGLLAICGFWAAAAALDAGIFAAFQSLCGSGAAARLLSDPDAVCSCLSGPCGGKSGVFFRVTACRFRSGPPRLPYADEEAAQPWILFVVRCTISKNGDAARESGRWPC